MTHLHLLTGLAARLARLRSRLRELQDDRGQALVLFVMMAVVMVGSAAAVTDVSWLWTNQQRMQRAADAASLAGAVYLPGDTGSLAATLEILKPTATGYVPATFSYTAARVSGASSASACDSRSGTNVTSVVTNTGGSHQFNGCRLTIDVVLPATYDAPHPATDIITSEGGWWKIRYTMGGSTSANSTDLTTWEVSIKGSPVHLVVG